MTKVASDWWRDFFSDIIVDMWLQAVPDEYTKSEVDFIQKMLRAAPGAKVLDAPCGGGRHALPMAAAGYQMTGVDLSADFLKAARSRAAQQKLGVTWRHQNMREISWENEFDGAYCFGNSFGYDDDEGNAAFLKAVCRCLKPSTRFVLDYPTVLEARLPKFLERNWMQTGDVFFLEDEHYDPVRGRTDTEYTLLREGQVDKRMGSHRNYTYREICTLLAEAGFIDVETYGSLNEEPFQLGSQLLFLIGRKPA
jgi:SAM-dependent methyltransferase